MQAKGEETGTGALALADRPCLIDSLRREAAELSTDALKAELARLLGFSAENLLRLAVVVGELESRGEDLSQLKIGLLPILRQIAAGTLLPDVVVLYAGQPSALKRIAAMPIAEQQRVAKGERAVSPDPPRPRHGRSSQPATECAMPHLKSIVANGGTKDVADMVLDMISYATRPDDVFSRVIAKAARNSSLSDTSRKAAIAALAILR